MKYKVRRQGVDLGFLPLEEVRRRRAVNEFVGNEYVQCEGSSDWQPVDLVLQQGYQATPPQIPKQVARPGLHPGIILGAVLLGVLMFGGFIYLGFRSAMNIQPRFNGNQAPARYFNNSSPQPAVDASKLPIVWTTNTLTAADANRRAREFRTRQWLAGYEQRGMRNPQSDAEAMEFLQTWLAWNYGGNAATNPISLATESDKLAHDPDCTDPLVFTIAAINNLNEFNARHLFERALAAYPGSRHLAYPQFYASLMLAAQKGEPGDRAVALEDDALPLLKKCFADGSFTPADQQEIAEIFVNGWGYNFFWRHPQAVCDLVHGAGPDYHWLALTLDGEREIIAAWAARGGGYANSVSDQGWKDFNSHLAAARTDLTAAWNLQPMWPLAPERMIYVSLGDADIDEMRVWFDHTTTAQIDYNRAWTDFRWGLRPRWYGNENSLLALGAAGINTGRFDTDVPRKYLDAVYDVESEMELPVGRHIFGRDDIWPNLKRMYEGYLAAPQQASEQKGWHSAYAVIAYFAGKYDVARAQLEAVDWKPQAQNLTGWSVDLSQMPLEVAARTGQLGTRVSAAEFLAHDGELSQAVEEYQAMAAADADPRTKQFIQLRLGQLEIARELATGKWVDWLPNDSNDPNWVFSFGSVKRLSDGALEVESGAQGHMLFSKIGAGENFEVRGQFENVRSANKNFQGGIVLGTPDFNGKNWYGFRLKRHDEEGDVVSFATGWTREQMARPVALNDGTNTFDLIFQNGNVVAFVNGEKVFHNIAPRGKINVPDDSYLIGLGAFSDSPDSVIRYRNVQVRTLH